MIAKTNISKVYFSIFPQDWLSSFLKAADLLVIPPEIFADMVEMADDWSDYNLPFDIVTTTGMNDTNINPLSSQDGEF